METFDNGVYIDGTYYQVPVLSCERSADFLWKYADRTEDGEHQGELLGVYFNYTLKFGQIVSRDEYNRIYDKLTEPTEYHTISMPGVGGSMFTFSAYFSEVKDAVKRASKEKTFLKICR